MPLSMSDGRQVDVGDAVMVAIDELQNLDKRLQKMEQRQTG